jgi:hypothetical protein
MLRSFHGRRDSLRRICEVTTGFRDHYTVLDQLRDEVGRRAAQGPFAALTRYLWGYFPSLARLKTAI